ncbi:MAG: lysostaphin resistance A-like protein, partial [Nitrososphaerales archaeon]
ELLFRGYIQGGAEKAMGSSNALVYSAVLFGLWHTAWGIPFTGSPVFAAVYAASYMLFASLSGIVLGVAYRSTKSLILPIFMHGLWNTFASLTSTSSQASSFFLGDPWRSLSFGLVVLFFYLVIPRVARFMKIERSDEL